MNETKTIEKLIELAIPHLEPPVMPEVVTFVYNAKPRLGVNMGDDQRPGTNNLMVLTNEGIKAFNKAKMENLHREIHVTTV